MSETFARRNARLADIPTWAEVEMNDDATEATCPDCGRRIGVVNPRQGDTSARKFRVHGSRSARCPGSNRTTW